MIKKSSKLENLKHESYEEKPYLTAMSMHDARMNFSLRSRMFNCKMNYLNNPKYKAELWRCDSCESLIDSQSHILYCPAYQQLRVGKSLSSDQDVVNYFKEVLEIRIRLDLNKWKCNLVLATARASLPQPISWGRRYAEIETMLFVHFLPKLTVVCWTN